MDDRYYVVDPLIGNDETGNGKEEAPFKTIEHVLNEYGSGSRIRVEDKLFSTKTRFGENTLVLENLSDITIEFFNSADASAKYANLIWSPEHISEDYKATIYIKNCSNITIRKATFAHTADSLEREHHISAIVAENTPNLKIIDCRVSPDGWSAGDGNLIESIDSGALISLKNCDDAEITGFNVNRFNNPYNIPYSILEVEGQCTYYINNTIIKNVTANNMAIAGLYVKPDTRKVIVNGFLAHNFIGDKIDSTYGIAITEGIEFTISSGQFSNCHIGIKIEDAYESASFIKLIKHCTFYKCLTAISVRNSVISAYSLSIYGGSTIVSRKNELNRPIEVKTTGIYAFLDAEVDCLNTIVTECYSAFKAGTDSDITLAHIVWSACEELKDEVNGGFVHTSQFIRRTDPQYENLHGDPWGYFMIKASSPCMDTGKDYGEEYLGTAPDIGAAERSESEVSDMVAFVSRYARYADYIPITEIDVEGMITQGLQTADSSIMAGREGSALKDISVKPMVGLLAKFVTELEYIKNNLSFLDFNNLSQDAADSLAANVFVTRSSGSRATGIVRLFFDNPVDAVVPAELVFSTAEGYMFYSTTAVTITANEMNLNYDNGLYYMDIPVEAQLEGSEYNVAAGEINQCFMTLPSGVVAISNPFAFDNGVRAETNAELYDKIQNSITTRDLVTKKGINFVLQDTFADITTMQVIGYGDEEMLRDTVFDDSIHIGGKVDIYMKLESDKEDSYIFDPIYEENELSRETFNKLPILRVKKLEILDPGTQDITGLEIPAGKWELKVVSVKTRLSIYEKLILKVDKAYVGYTVKMVFEWAEGLKAIQSWLIDSDNRVVCADLWARHFYPVFISFNLYYSGEEEIPGLASLLGDYVTEHKSDAMLQASDIIDYVYTLGPVHVTTPFTISAEIHSPDGSIKTVYNEDEVGIDRIQCYMPGDITCTYLKYEK